MVIQIGLVSIVIKLDNLLFSLTPILNIHYPTYLNQALNGLD